MKKPTTISKESVSEYREFVQLRLRKRVLEAIEIVLEEEVDQALGCRSYERAEDRCGYRNGAETRRVTTSVGNREPRVPRARVRDEETGETTEFRSELLPRYARWTREVDEAILGTYLSGTNSRRIRKALKRYCQVDVEQANLSRRADFLYSHRTAVLRKKSIQWYAVFFADHKV